MAVLGMLAMSGLVVFALIRFAIWLDSVPMVRRARIDRQVRREAGAVVAEAERALLHQRR